MYTETVRYLLAYLQNWHGKPVEASSLVVNFNSPIPLHRDVHNSGEHLNYVMGLGKYQGGELWVENATSLNKPSEPNQPTVGQEVGPN